MRNVVLAMALLAFAGMVVLGVAQADDAKYTIKDVMKQAHAGGEKSLLSKVASGKGEKADAEKLVEMYKALCANKPPKGDEKAWTERCQALIKCAESCAKGDAGAGPKLRQCANCKACHDLFKGK